MPKLVFALFCQQAIVDRESNNVSVINQLDMLRTQRPSIAPFDKGDKGKKVRAVAAFPCAVVTVWERNKPTVSEGGAFLVDFLGPNREPLGKYGVELNLRKTRRVRNVARLPGIPLVGEGTYRFVLRCRQGSKWRKAGEVTFELTYTDSQPTRVH